MRKYMVLFLFVCGLSALTAQTAVIREFSGTVEIKAPGASEWTPAAVGQRLENATMISTGFRSTAQIGLGNSVLTVRALTRLTLEEIRQQEGNEQVNINLQTGRVRADVAPPAGGRTDFTVRSPSATASVRGTSFEFDGTRLEVQQGRVRVRGGDGTPVFVSAGHETTVDPATGKTPRTTTTLRQTLVPPTPAGMSTTLPSSAAPAPRTDFVDIELTW
ncbi:hypothetical protein FACS1894151_00610 [Spirochaetia bacterium]|nr:hypothetical protein FACS1894151_00610 [Spirochaetia bacterium]